MKLLNITTFAVLLSSLLIYSSTHSQNHHSSTPDAKQDLLITSNIQSYIHHTANLEKLKPLEIKTEKGVVTISGNVDSDSQASLIIARAQSIVGVRDINVDHLKIKESTQLLKDMLITAKIKGLLIREDIFGTNDIASINLSVETNNGIVYLTGVVDDQTQLKNAIKLIEGMKDVKKVEYNVTKITPAHPRE